MINIREECRKRYEIEKGKEYLGTVKPVNLIKPLVSVIVTTYQHKNYIKKCLEGILMQITDFPFEIVLGEDESKDGTREICIEYAEKYPDKIRLFLRDRKTSQFYNDNGNLITRFNGIWNRMSARGKYIAWCEGDDYWTDHLKLQKQVAFLEANPDYGLVFTDADHYYERDDKLIAAYDRTLKRKIPTGNVMHVFMRGVNPYKTCTSMFRRRYIEKSAEILNKQRPKAGDFVLWMLIAGQTKVGYINSATAVYRIREKSASHFEDLDKLKSFLKSAYRTALFFSKYFNICLDKKSYKKSYRNAIITYCVNKKHFKALLKYAACFPLVLAAYAKKLIKHMIIFIRERNR